MRALLPPVIALASAACTTTQVLTDPQLRVAPYWASNELRGKIAMQSDNGSGPVDNEPQSLRQFGQDHSDDDWGVRLDVGDGFAGLRLDWMAMDGNTTKHGVLDDDWGALQAGDTVRMSTKMDEYRLGYMHPLLVTRTELRENALEVRLAAGGYIAHRNLRLRAQTEDGSRQQALNLDDRGVLYPALRGQVTWREFSFDLDWGISPNLAFGGDFAGTLQDLEMRVGWRVPRQDITFFGGWRYSLLPAEGHEGGLAYDADLSLQGFQLGVLVLF